MKTEIEDFGCFTPTDLYALYQDVYSSSEGMSETLEDKYQCLDDFEEGTIAFEPLSGAIALVVEVARRPAAYLKIRPMRRTRVRGRQYL